MYCWPVAAVIFQAVPITAAEPREAGPPSLGDVPLCHSTILNALVLGLTFPSHDRERVGNAQTSTERRNAERAREMVDDLARRLTKAGGA